MIAHRSHVACVDIADGSCKRADTGVRPPYAFIASMSSINGHALMKTQSHEEK